MFVARHVKADAAKKIFKVYRVVTISAFLNFFFLKSQFIGQSGFREK